MMKANKGKQNFIQYADLVDVAKMMNVGVDGGIMDVVNDVQKWLEEE
jgi:hypothetical protein